MCSEYFVEKIPCILDSYINVFLQGVTVQVFAKAMNVWNLRKIGEVSAVEKHPVYMMDSYMNIFWQPIKLGVIKHGK